MNWSEIRRCHNLSVNNRDSRPSRWIVFDTETAKVSINLNHRSEYQSMRLGVARYFDTRHRDTSRGEWCTFTDQTDFWAFVQAHLSTREPLWMAAHNLPFDWGILSGWTTPKAMGWSEEWRCLYEPPTVIYYRTLSGNVRVIDTLNYVRAPLAEIGAELGLDKLPMPAHNAPLNDWRTYCVRDVEILECLVRTLLTWHKANGLGTWRPTLAGIAWNAFRHRFMDHRILCHGNSDTLYLEKSAYRGGRCSAFFPGATPGTVVKLDMRGAYASVMATEPMPVRLLRVEVMPDMRTVLANIKEYGAVARVKLNAHTNEYPVVRDERVQYVRGRFTTVLAAPELRRALACCEVVSIGKIAWYEQAVCFKRFSEWAWGERKRLDKEGNQCLARLAKSLPCALYGRFGQQRVIEQRQECVQTPVSDGAFTVVDCDDRTVYNYIAKDTVAYRQIRDSVTEDACPAIAATVTSALRVRMDDIRRIAGEHHCYLQYVDALIVDREGLFNVLAATGTIGSGMGQMREDGEYASCTIHNNGWWDLNGERHCTGMPRKATLLDDGSYEYLHFESGKEQLKRGPDGSILVSRRQTLPPNGMLCGTVGADGWVSPVVLDER